MLMFTLMLAGLLMSAAIPNAFGHEGLLFAIAYAFIQVVRSTFTVFALRGRDRLNHRNFLRITAWLLVSAVFWMLGGFLAGRERVLAWCIALAVEISGPTVGHIVPGLGRSTTADWKIDGAHMAERCMRQIAKSADPGRIGRDVYTYFHIPIVAGIVVCTVADEIAIAHPGGQVHLAEAFALLGGPALYLLGNVYFKRASAQHYPLSHLVGLGLLAAVAPFALEMSTLALGAATTGVLVTVAIWETRSFAAGPGTRTAEPQAH